MTRSPTTWLVAAALGIVTAGVGQAQYSPRPLQSTVEQPEAERLADGLRRSATPYGAIPAPHGKSQYRNLLRQFEVAADRATYGDFYDYGFWTGGSYAGQNDLPAGYWVYLAPNWYIFKDDASTSAAAQTPRSWAPEQATGAPDTWPRSGDLGTAWASRTPDGQREWLELTYDAPVKAAAVTIYETFNPGAVDRVTGYDANGKEVELWAGADPTPVGKDKGISVIPIKADFEISRVRIYLDSPKVPGWNEIDAVGLLDEAGTTHWAKSATASSSYADVTGAPVQEFGVDRLESLRLTEPAR